MATRKKKCSDVDARRLIAENVVDAIEAFVATDDDEGRLMQAIMLSAASNNDGGMTQDDICKLHSWFHESIKRATVLGLFLRGLLMVRPDGESVTVEISEVFRREVGDGATIDDAKEHSGWCGLIAAD